MTRLFIVRVICLRCGKINDYDLGLTNKDDDAVYKCENCNYIVITSWMEDQE